MGSAATGVKNVRQSHAPDVIRDLVNRTDSGGQAWKDMLDDLAAYNGASLHVSTFVKGSSVCIDEARKTGSGHVDPIEPSGFHMVSMSRKNTRIQWDVPRSKSSVVVVNLLIDLSNNIDHNLYLTLSRNIAQALRFSNTSLTWIESASVIPVEGGLNFITLALSDEHAHIFVNGELKLRKKRKMRDEIDRLLLNLMSHESADLGAVFYGLEVWEQDGLVKGFENSGASALQGELSKLISKGNIANICSFLTTYDDVDLSPMSDNIVKLLDKSLESDGVYPDWAVEQVLEALPQSVANDWRLTRKSRLPTPNIQVDSLFVRLYRNPATKWAISNLIRLRKADTFLAINDVNFNIYPGDIVGIIGANGAGKSTLLKTINNLIPVESGTITLMDKPLLLSPGLGIRDELSGKKNIQLVCCYMGLSEEESALLYDGIVEFSELQEFIDQPYKFYSDGMKSRLVFSIATAVAPNIMMLDELLNAGDIGFQQKAARRMEEVIDRAKSVVVVTHSIPFVLERCNKAVLLHLGKQIAYGDPRSVVARYLDILQIGNITDISGIIVGSG